MDSLRPPDDDPVVRASEILARDDLEDEHPADAAAQRIIDTVQRQRDQSLVDINLEDVMTVIGEWLKHRERGCQPVYPPDLGRRSATA